ncbi:RNI-like protein [Coprinopsis marcescibilis]|uniref:RNI-like protein n=1 Tax=Coprinopsis marcescibilis TaxID=230819 RepID=A0A5C3KX55_COPMA|nr:RNI-like protein [Coprinopsis marcescibilis]
MSASEHECQTPSEYVTSTLELVEQILSYVTGHHDFHPFLGICKTWFHASAPLLWREPELSSYGRFLQLVNTIRSPTPFVDYSKYIKILSLEQFSYIPGERLEAFFPCTNIRAFSLSSRTDDRDFQVSMAESLQFLLPHFTKLDKLDLSDIKLLPETVPHVVARNPNLRTIGLDFCGTHISDMTLATIGDHCPQLTELSLLELARVTGQGILSLSRRGFRFVTLSCEGPHQITNDMVSAIWTSNHRIEHLDLNNATDLTDEGFPALGSGALEGTGLRYHQNLRTLCISACPDISDDSIEEIVRHAPHLSILRLPQCILLTDISLAAISTLGSHLCDLDLRLMPFITDNGLTQIISQCTRLKSLELGHSPQITSSSIAKLACLTDLQVLSLMEMTNVCDKAVYALADGRMANTLRELYLIRCRQPTAIAVHYLLDRCPRLVCLDVSLVPTFHRSPVLSGLTPRLNDAQRLYMGKSLVDKVRKAIGIEIAIREHLDILVNLYPSQQDQPS